MKTSFTKFAFLLICIPLFLALKHETLINTPPNKYETTIDGIDYFIKNFDDFEMCVSFWSGCHDIIDVSYESSDLIVESSYRGVIFRGKVQLNEDARHGIYKGTYKNNTDTGKFTLVFNSDGGADGKYEEDGFWGSSGAFTFERK